MFSFISQAKNIVGHHKSKVILMFMMLLAVAGTALLVPRQLNSGTIPTSEQINEEVIEPTLPVVPNVAKQPSVQTTKTHPDSGMETADDSNQPMGWPGQGPVISEFGFYYSEVLNDRRFHSGIDIQLPAGYEVRAVLSGTISAVSTNPLWGGEVVIKHRTGIETRYKGIKARDLKVSTVIDKGDVIGTVGPAPKMESNLAPHLHFEVWDKGKPVDPLKHLP